MRQFARDAVAFVDDVDLAVVIHPALTSEQIVHAGRLLVPRVVILVSTPQQSHVIFVCTSQQRHVMFTFTP